MFGAVHPQQTLKNREISDFRKWQQNLLTVPSAIRCVFCFLHNVRTVYVFCSAASFSHTCVGVPEIGESKTDFEERIAEHHAFGRDDARQRHICP